MPRIGTREVAVIGAGYAGLSAALTLAQGAGNVRVTLFEAAKMPGGRARAIQYQGETLDNGQHILSGAYTELLRLMALVGSPANAVSQIPLSLDIPPAFHLKACALPAPFHTLIGLLTAKGLNWRDKWAAVCLLVGLRRQQFKVGPQETVAELLARERQTETITRFVWAPLTISALNTPIETASAQVFANVLRDALMGASSASDLILPQVDLTALFPAPAGTWLTAHGHEVHYGTRVSAIERNAAHASPFLLSAESLERRFDAVILAIGPHQFHSLSLPPEIVVPSLTYEPIVTVYFKWDQPVHLPRVMLGQVDQTAQWWFDRRTIAGQQAQSDGLIAAVISATGDHQHLTAEHLVTQLLKELARHTGPLPTPLWTKVITEKFATFACTPDCHQARPETATACAGLVLAGDYVAGEYPGTLEGAVRNGIRAANAIHHYLDSSAP